MYLVGENTDLSCEEDHVGVWVVEDEHDSVTRVYVLRGQRSIISA